MMKLERDFAVKMTVVTADTDLKSTKNKIDQPKTYEDLLKNVGEFGKYQKRLVLLFMIPISIMSPWYMLGSVFSTNTPDHWCKVPEIESSGLPLNIQKTLIRPKNDRYCAQYAVNYTELLRSGNLTVDLNWPTEPCKKGWSYDTSDYDATATTKWNMVCHNRHYSSVVKSLVFFGNLVGTPVFGHFSDKFGRKKTFFTLAGLIVVTDISSVLVPNFSVFLFLRFLNGSAATALYIVGYIMLVENVGVQMRGTMNGIGCSGWTLGLCLLPLLAWLTRNWITLSAVTTSSSLALFVLWKFIPESPRWLLSRNRYEEASQVLATISKTNGKTTKADPDEMMKQLEKLKDHIDKEGVLQNMTYSAVDLMRHRHLRKRFCLISFCWIVNAAAYFGLQLNVENLSGNEFLNFFLLSVVEFPSHIITWFFMEKYGRRWCTAGGFAMTTLICIIPVIFSRIPLVGIVCSVLGKLSSSSSFMIVYQLAPELFPTPLRGIGISLSGTFGNMATFTSPYIVYLAIFDKSMPFMIFSLLNLMAVVCACFIPETLNQKLPQTLADTEANNEKFFTCYRKQSLISKNGSVLVPHSPQAVTTNSDLSADNPGLSLQDEVMPNQHAEPRKT